MARVEEIRPPIREDQRVERFWDQPLQDQLYTEGGYKAVFPPTKGGGGTSWQNKEIVIGLEVQYADGSREEVEVVGGVVDKIQTQRSSTTAVMKIKSHAKTLQDDQAERVRDGSRWYENERLSYILNRLLEQVFRDADGNLPLDKRAKANKLKLNTIDGEVGYWSLGKPPGWDGETYTPDTNAYPVTSLCTGPDRDYIYVGLGGRVEDSESYSPQLWKYHIDTNTWTFLQETDPAGSSGVGDDDTTYAQIHNLFYNTEDGYLYGVLWRDWADSEDSITEADTPHLDWMAPPARIFWFKEGQPFLDHDTYSHKIDNFWTGQWDFREMFMTDKNLNTQVSYDGGTGGTVSGSEPHNDGQPDKATPLAGVGNFSAFKYIMLPTPDGDHAMLPEGVSNIEHRRQVHRYWPQPSWNNWYNDVVTADWNDLGTGELIPTTPTNANTQWTNASGATPPDGWSTYGNDSANTTYSVTNGVLTMNVGSGSDKLDRCQLVHTLVERNMTVFRIRVEGLSGGQVFVGGTPVGIGGSGYFDWWKTQGPLGFPWGGAIGADGDYYFTYLQSNAIPNMGAQGQFDEQSSAYLDMFACLGISFAPNSYTSPLQINNLSVAVARYWDRSHEEKYSAGENIPITGFSKIVVCTYISPSSHKAEYGPYFDSYANNSVNQYSSRNAVPDLGDDLNMEYFLEFNFIAQDRSLIEAGMNSACWNGLWGPSYAEEGVAPDNTSRFIIGTDESAPGVGAVNEEKIITVAPDFYEANAANMVIGQNANLYGNPEHYIGARKGHGYGSVQVIPIGEPAMWHTSEDNYEISGAVRYTNGQQGFFCFSQEADDGNGLILFAQFDGESDATASRRNRWGPDNYQHLGIKYSVMKCSDHSVTDFYQGTTHAVGGTILTKRSNTNPPYHTTDQYDAIYPIAGCADATGTFYISAVESITYETKSASGAQVGKNYLFCWEPGTDPLPAIGSWPSPYTKWTSTSDASVYNTDGVSTCYGNLSDNYYGATGAAGPVDNFRKILWLHYSTALEEIVGWCFRRDRLLADPDGVSGVGIPCHEVFVYSGTNSLKIIDHDIADSMYTDSVGFVGFCDTQGNFATDIAPPGTSNALWYFRVKKVSVGGGKFEYIGEDIVMNCAYLDGSGNIIAGEYWDNADSPDESTPLYPGEHYLGAKVAVSALVDKGLTTEREAIFSSFDQALSYFHIGKEARDSLGDSTWDFFKLDDREVDPIIQVADFTGLTVFDAIAQLARANNFIFGFDINEFFMVDRDTTSLTHTFDSALGEIKDITKQQIDNIKNVITIQPYTPQVQDLDWEVTHVGTEEDLADEELFNGDLVITVKTHKELSMNFICSRKGRLILDREGDPSEDTTIIPVDALNDPEERYTPFFKFKTNAPLKKVILMRNLAADDTTVYTNTVFTGGSDPIQVGDAIIFTHPTTFVQFGRIITDIDTTNSEITIEGGPGFAVEKGMPLDVVTTSIGTFQDINGNTKIHDYANTWSDQGVCVITSAPTLTTGLANEPGSGFTKFTVNNIAPFRGFKFRHYNADGYRYYPFLITTQNSIGFASGTQSLPKGALSTTPAQGTPSSWIWDVDEDTRTIYLNGRNDLFVQGDVLNVHFAMPPATLIKQLSTQGRSDYEPPPYQSLTTDFPSGLAHFHWYCDELTDKFNVGDIINLHFKGVRLVKDGGSAYTGANMDSVNRYGERPWPFPDNRFIAYDRARYWVARRLIRDSDAKLKIQASVAFTPSLSFIEPEMGLLREVKVIDHVMFPTLPGFATSGVMTSMSMDPATLTTTFEFISKEPY